MPASWNESGYTALFIAEMPEVRFDDVMVVRVAEKRSEHAIDSRFVEVCDAETIEVCGTSCNMPLAVGALAHDGVVAVRLAEKPALPVRVVLRLTGIRRGFRNLRFPDRTHEEFLANERFLRMAQPSGR